MGIFSKLFHPRDKPQDRTTGSSFAFYLGGSTSGKAVTERSAMQMTAVYACVRILSEAIAGLPLHLYRYKEGGGKEKAIDHPLYRLLHDEPNPEMTSFVFRETLMTHLLLWGNAYAQIIRNGKGEVIALYPLMPNKMEVDRDENGVLVSGGEDAATPVAVGFRARKANGKYKYYWLYRVLFGVPATNLATKGDSITFSTPTIEGTIFRRNKVDAKNNHPWKAEVTESEENSEIISKWYDSVYEPTYGGE